MNMGIPESSFLLEKFHEESVTDSAAHSFNALTENSCFTALPVVFWLVLAAGPLLHW